MTACCMLGTVHLNIRPATMHNFIDKHGIVPHIRPSRLTPKLVRCAAQGVHHITFSLPQLRVHPSQAHRGLEQVTCLLLSELLYSLTCRQGHHAAVSVSHPQHKIHTSIPNIAVSISATIMAPLLDPREVDGPVEFPASAAPTLVHGAQDRGEIFKLTTHFVHLDVGVVQVHPSVPRPQPPAAQPFKVDLANDAVLVAVPTAIYQTHRPDAAFRTLEKLAGTAIRCSKLRSTAAILTGCHLDGAQSVPRVGSRKMEA